MVHICVGDLCHRWFRLKAFCMNGVKSLDKPTLTYCQLGMCEQPSLEFVSKYNKFKKMYLKESSVEHRPFYFVLNVLTSFVMSLSLLAIEFGAPHDGVKLVNNGSCDGLVPDGNSPLFDFTLIQCVFIIIIIGYLFIYSFISTFRDPTLIQCVLTSIIIDYLLVSLLN